MEGPMINKLKSLKENRRISFHTPGHKHGKAFFKAGDYGIKDQLYDFDITEIDGADQLMDPQGVIKKSQDMGKEILGGDEVYYLVNGSTGGILSMLFSQLQPGEELLLPRSVHQSVMHGLLLGRITPRWIAEKTKADKDYPEGVTLEEVKEAYKKAPGAKAVFLTHPNYFGVPCEIKEIREWTLQKGLMLLIDQAHGAHFHLAPEVFSDSAITKGADLTVLSFHKTLPSLTQTAVLVGKGNHYHRERLREGLKIFQTTSPSYLFLASLEGALLYSLKEGQKEMKSLLFQLEKFEKRFQQCRGFRLYREEPTKLWIKTLYEDLSGKEIKEILGKDYGIEMELETSRGVLALVTTGNDEKDLEKLVLAFEELDKTLYNKKRIIDRSKDEEWGNAPQSSIPLWQAFYKEKKWVSIEISKGKIAGSMVTPYPPGIPLLVPGERIGEKEVLAIKEMLKKQKQIIGIKKGKTPKIPIIKEEE